MIRLIKLTGLQASKTYQRGGIATDWTGQETRPTHRGTGLLARQTSAVR